tara:strand:+ start:508 stop:879 length:372 start_codon:yes stop_codon:yes gene_type:complete
VVPDTEFKIPEDLVEAIEMSSLERMLPKQGNREVIRYLTDTKDKEAAKSAEKWVESQKAVWPKVDEVVIRLHKVAPMQEEDLAPAWTGEEWWIALCMPWSDNLEEAVKSAHVWCDRRENAKSS